jgi:hypothetical protein
LAASATSPAYRAKGKNLYRKHYPKPVRGYLALSQPQYRPGDSLLGKAYLAKPGGRPLTRPLELWLSTSHNIPVKRLQTIHPDPPGNYAFALRLPDSLRLSQRYEVQLWRGLQKYADNHFTYADYQLNETKYQARLTQTVARAGETVKVGLTGTDANRLPVLDGHVELWLLSTRGLAQPRYGQNNNYYDDYNYRWQNRPADGEDPWQTQFYADRLFVPDTLWQHRQPLDAWGETLVALPDAAFVRAADYPCQLKVRFNNANNETHDTTLRLPYRGQPHQFKVRLDSGWLHADYLVNGQPTPAQGTGARTYEGGHGTQQMVEFPWRARLDPAVTEYQLATAGTSYTFDPRQWPHGVAQTLAQGADTVRYTLRNPHRVPVWFTLYRNKKRWVRGLVQGDTTFTLRTQGPHQSVSAVVDFRWAGEPKMLRWNSYGTSDEVVNSAFYPKNLQVEVETPAQAQPGQKVEVAVQVRDHQGRPVPRTNLTVWAVNQQFADQNLPTVPYLGRAGHTVLRPRQFRSEAEEADRESTQRRLDPATMREWGLAQNEYYRLMFPPQGLYEAYLPTKSGVAQVQPLVLAQGRPVDQFLVLLDSIPVYYLGADQKYNGCIAAPPGKHRLTIRTPGRTYVVDSIEVRPAQKLVISLATDGQHPRVRTTRQPNHLTKAEIAFANQFMVKVLSDYYANFDIWVTQGQRQYLLPLGSNGRHHAYGYPYYQIGPFLPQGGELTATVFKNGNLADTVKFARQRFSGLLELKDKVSRFSMPIRDKSWKVLWRNYLNLKYNNGNWRGELNLRDELPVPVNAYPKAFSYVWDILKSNLYLEGKKRSVAGPASLAFTVWDTLTRAQPTPPKQVSRNPNEKIVALALSHLADSSLIVVSLRDGQTIVHNLPTGCFRAAIITNQNRIFLLDTVCLRPHGLTYRQFGRAQPDTLRGDDDLQRRLPFKTDWDRWLDRNQAKLRPNPRVNLEVTANSASPYAITGRVFSKEDKLAIPGASVLIKGTNIGALTDVNGFFTIRPGSSSPITLVFSYVGFVTSEAEARNGDNVEITLEEDVRKLEEVVVVGYSTQSKAYMTASISTVSQTLQGKIPGVVIRGAGSLGPLTSADVLKLAPSLPPASEATGEAPSPTSLRRNFRDHAFWRPTLTTNAQGRARFTATLPDNLTRWRTYAIAMNRRRQSGLGTADLQAFKPVAATLATPRFLVEGDSTQLVGKVLNYTDQPRQVRAGFQLDGQALAPADTLVKDFYLAHLPVVAGRLADQDSVRATFATQQAELSDGEVRAIPLVERGPYQTHGQFWLLSRDTTFTISTADWPNGAVTLYAHRHSLDLLRQEVQRLQNYEHLCNEQLASQLMAHLTAGQINRALGEPDKSARPIQKILNQLAQRQKPDGSWGWWEGDANYWVTNYVASKLVLATQAGHPSRALDKALEFLADHFAEELVGLDHRSAEWKHRDWIATALTLSAVKGFGQAYRATVDSLIRTHGPRLQSAELQLKLLKLQQNLGLPYKLDGLWASRKQTRFGAIYWGRETYGWYDNQLDMTTLAYDLLRQHGGYQAHLPQVLQFFLERRRDWNTYQIASIAQTVLPDLLASLAANEAGNFYVDLGQGETKIDKFPYTFTGRPAQLRVRKQGGPPVYCTAYTRTHVPDPPAEAKDFRVSTWFATREGQRLDTLRAGQPVELVVQVNCTKSSDYVLVEVPIPAGCSYQPGSTRRWSWASRETHREYFRHKVAIYVERLGVGQHEFKIGLQPRFTGRYTLNPARAELMYFPVFYGREGSRQVVIGAGEGR